MNAGKLTERITIQKREETRLPSGQIVGEWSNVCTVWAEVNCTDSKAVDESGVIHHEGLFRFYIRYRTDLTAEMRVLWKNRTFTLVGPPADWKTEREGLTLITKELV